MRTAIERAYRRTPGGDLLVGVLATCLAIAVLLGAGTIAAGRTMPLERTAVVGLGALLANFISIPVLVGIYARVGRDEDESGVDPETTRIAGIPDGRLRETARLTLDTLRRRGRVLVAGLGVALVVSLLVGILATLVLHAVVLTILTIAGYISYALGYGQLVSAVRMFHLSGVLVGLGLSVGVLSVRFFDCVVCWTDAGPVSAVRESLRFARTRPLTVLGYALVTTVLFTIPSVVTYLVAPLHEPLAIGVFVLLTSACVAVYATFHARVCYRHLLPVCCGTALSEQHSSGDKADSQSLSYTVRNRPLVANPVALVLALLLVTALLVGSGSVRALDVQPVDAVEEPGPVDEFDDATALIDDAAMPQTEANHRAVDTTYAYNETQERWEKPVQFQYETDHQQRRHLVSFTTFDHNDTPTSSTTAYFSTKQFAMQWTDPQDPQPPSEPADHAWHERTAGNWTVYSVAGYEIIDQPTESITTTPEFFDQEWAVVDESHDTITIAASGPDPVPVNRQGYGSVETADVEVTLDRETGYVVEISQELIREDDDLDAVRTHVEFEDWDDHTVDRPDGVEVQPVEWVWGVASY